jgi:glycosyltransferase involved in cell wall biosynthesis
MRIGIDATWAGVRGSGTGSYTRGLVEALIRHEAHEFVLYFRPGDERVNPLWPGNLSAKDRQPANHYQANVKLQIVAGWKQPGRTLFSLAAAAIRDRIDVFHSPGYFLPLWKGPKVATFHDANMFLQHDMWWRPGMRLSWLSLCSQTVLASRLARSIATDSNWSRAAIIHTLHVPERKVSVLYPGVEDRFFDSTSRERVDEVKAKYGLDEYVLVLGVLSPQKNLEGALQAYARVQTRGVQLAIAGRDDGPYFDEAIVPLASRLGIAAGVRKLGIVSSEDLPALYAGARVLLYPSFAEGFGLPPLEAMATGTPVVASAAASLPEVLGDAACLVDPRSPDSIAAALDQVLTDPALRARMVQRGRRRAAGYRWDTCANLALDLYAAVA